MMFPSFTYRATVVKIIDADTFDLIVDLGLRVTTKIRVRLYGVNAPELRTDEGKIAKQALIALMPGNTKVTVSTFKDPTDKYGRWLAKVELENGVNVSSWLLENGHAVEAWT